MLTAADRLDDKATGFELGGLHVTVQLPAAPPHRRGVCQEANGLGTGLGDGYRVPQGRPGHLDEEVDKSPEGA
jgi:hypothetical protein